MYEQRKLPALKVPPLHDGWMALALHDLRARTMLLHETASNPVLHVRVHEAPSARVAPSAQAASSAPLCGAESPLTVHEPGAATWLSERIELSAMQ